MFGAWEILVDRPWIIALCVILLAIWICSIWIIFQSGKFLRKPLWALLTLLSFTVRWPADGATISLAIPLGALYVLWFARFGRHPTPEEIAKRGRAAEAPTIASRHLQVLRVAYGLLALACFGLIGWVAFGPAVPALFAQVDGSAAALPNFRSSMLVFGLLFGAFFVLLVARPYPWAKLVCGFAAFAWLMHGLISLFIMPQVLGAAFPTALHATITAGAGLIAAACGIIHYRIDPRLSGPLLRPT